MKSHRAPHKFPRRILLAVTGLSPQIVTETLYALAVAQKPAFVPTEIHLLTTAEGARLVRAALLHPDGGQFQALLNDYPRIARPKFDESRVHIITGPDGPPLADIRTPEENAAAADAITSLVAELTSDEDSAIHVSVAGGRKTMGFYLGYAFSLFARPQDRLSHVLVTAPFESHPEFFYPPRTPRRLATRGGGHIDTADATVTLADIPVVRLRHGLPVALLRGAASFNETVAAVQASLAAPILQIDLPGGRVLCGEQVVAMKPQLLAWLTWWAWLRKAKRGNGQGYVSWRDASSADIQAFLTIYRAVVGLHAADFEATSKLLSESMEREFFQQKNSKLERVLRDALGPAAAPYLLGQEGQRPHTRRGLSLASDAIRITGLPAKLP